MVIDLDRKDSRNNQRSLYSGSLRWFGFLWSVTRTSPNVMSTCSRFPCTPPGYILLSQGPVPTPPSLLMTSAVSEESSSVLP